MGILGRHLVEGTELPRVEVVVPKEEPGKRKEEAPPQAPWPPAPRGYYWAVPGEWLIPNQLEFVAKAPGGVGVAIWEEIWDASAEWRERWWAAGYSRTRFSKIACDPARLRELALRGLPIYPANRYPAINEGNAWTLGVMAQYRRLRGII